MSVFSGWDRESLAALKAAMTGSPEGLALLAGLLLAGLLAVSLVVFFATRQIGGFFLKVREDEERARAEEEEAAAKAADSTSKRENEG